jgi:hypothetical protein
MYSSKNVLGVYFLKVLLSKKTPFLGVFLSQEVEQTRGLCAVLYIPGGLEGLFDFYDPLHHHPWARHSPRQ